MCIYDSKIHMKEILKHFGMFSSNPTKLPMVEGIKLEINMGEQEIIATQYKQVVYKLINLINSKLDIVYVINVVSRFMVEPQKPHMQTIKQVLKYLRGTLDFNIIYCKSEHINFKGFIYLDWVGDVEIKRLTSGYVFTLGISPMTWCQNDNPQFFFMYKSKI